ncbi:MAG: hemerythrin family protein [Victivallaceae bacterium]
MQKLYVPIATGIIALDMQHEHFHKMINEFAVICQDHKVDNTEAAKFFSEAVEYVVDHFDSEEFFMRSIDYPYYDSHVEQHDKLRADMEKYAEELAKTENISKFAENFAEQVSEWFARHVATADARLSEYYHKNNPPEQKK